MKYIIITSGNALIINNVTILGNVVVSVEANTYIVVSQDGKELTRMLWNDILTIDDSEPASLEEAYSLLQTSVSALVPNNQLSDLKDTSITDPANNQVLTYNNDSKKWVNKDPTGGSGGTGSVFLKKQVFAPSVITLEYIAPAVSPFTIGATVTGDQSLATGVILSIDDVNGILQLNNIIGNFDGSDLQYTDDFTGVAVSASTPGAYITDVQILDDTGVLYYEPKANDNKPVPKAKIILPLNPTDGQQVLIHFGNLLFQRGVEITTPSITCDDRNHVILPNTSPQTKAQVGAPVRVIFREIPDDEGIIGIWYLG